MQWDDFKYLLAVMRGGSLLKAARSLNVDKTTVSRRIAALGADLGAPLVEKDRTGRLGLTDQGRRVAMRAEAMEDAARHIRSDLGHDPGGVAGRVRLTAVPLVAHHLLIPQLTALAPGLVLELIAEPRDLSLTDGDADIALRLARPRDGGQAVLAHKLARLEYGCYAARGAGTGLPWIGYDRGMQHLSLARKIEGLAAQPGACRADLSVNDAESLLQAVLRGAGKSLLPCRVAEAQTGLMRVDMPGVSLPAREVWLLTRRDVAALDRVRAVTVWLEDIFKTS